MLTNIYENDHIPAIDSMRTTVCWRLLGSWGPRPAISNQNGLL